MAIRMWIVTAAIGALALAGCETSNPRTGGGSPPPQPAADASAAADVDAGSAVVVDSGLGVQDAASAPTDAGSVADPDAAAPVDGSTVPGPSELAPGSHVMVDGRRVAIGDVFSQVQRVLGAGARAGRAEARSYSYQVGATTLDVWFANSNLDADDNAPNDVDDDDEVLWIAVSGAFAGRTPDGLGSQSERSAVEMVHGASPRETPLEAPEQGTLATYYTSGFLVAYDTGDRVRTYTVCRTYPREPSGILAVSQGTVDFGGGAVITGGQTEEARVVQVLGTPDAQGQVRFTANVSLKLLSYSFIGIEVWIGSITGRAFFVSVHSPYYGRTAAAATSAGLGTSRTDFLDFLAREGFGAGSQSTASMNVVCYHNPASGKYLGVSYATGGDAKVTTLSIAFPELACR